MAGTRTRRKTTPPRNAAITVPDQTAELPKVPVDVDLLAHWTDTERAITAAHTAAIAALEERTLQARQVLTGVCNYALTDLAGRIPGFMGLYYQAATVEVFTPPVFVDPNADTVFLDQLPVPRELAPPVAAPVVPPVEAPYVEAEILPHPDEERIARSLTVAQQFADKTVNDAKEHADEIVAAAEAEAQARAAGMAPSFEHDEATADDFFAPKEVGGGDRA